MAKTFKNPTTYRSGLRAGRKHSAYGKRNEKRFNSVVGSVRNADPRYLNLYELDDIAGETKYNLKY